MNTIALKKILISCCLLWLAGCTAPDNAHKVSLEQARSELESGQAILIDIREPAEHRMGVAPGAQLLPMSQLPSKLAQIPQSKNQAVLLICNTQNRSQATLKELQKRGYANVRYVEGGMSQWAAKGWPMVPPQP